MVSGGCYSRRATYVRPTRYSREWRRASGLHVHAMHETDARLHEVRLFGVDWSSVARVRP